MTHSAISKYRFTERPQGFRIEAEDRTPVTVTLWDTGFRVEGGTQRQLRFPDIWADGKLLGENPDVSLVRYRQLVDLVAGQAMRRWGPPPDTRKHRRLRAWAYRQTARALGGRIHEQWRRLIAKADPTVLGVQKAVFAASFCDAPLLHEPLLYRDRYLAGDLQRYRAAAAIVPVAEDLYEAWQESASDDELSPGGPPARRDRREEAVLDVEDDATSRRSPQEVIERLADWQGLLSPDGAAYRSLCRTLMNFPGGISTSLLSYLQELRLERPVTDRLELLALLLAQEACDQCIDAESRSVIKIFMHARRTQIRAGLLSVGHALARPLSHRRTKDVQSFVQYVCDYPDDHHGSLGGLVRKAIQWHAAAGWHGAGSTPPNDLPTKRAPIELPQQEGIRFLDSLGGVIAEGEAMRHCIAAYATRAVGGRSYLFHVEFAGEQASVEVDELGRVRQACGPGNSTNRATEYASRALSQWGEGLAGGRRPRRASSQPTC